MDKVIFRPNILWRIPIEFIFFVLVLLVELIILKLGMAESNRAIFVPVSLILDGALLVLLIKRNNISKTKMVIQNDIMEIKIKPSFKPVTVKTVNLANIASLRWNIETYYKGGTKSYFSIKYKDGQDENIYMYSWDFWSLKKIVSFLKNKYPNIEFAATQTHPANGIVANLKTD